MPGMQMVYYGSTFVYIAFKSLVRHGFQYHMESSFNTPEKIMRYMQAYDL